MPTGDTSPGQNFGTKLEDVNTLRRRFFEEYRNLIENGRYAVEDVRRIKQEDWFLSAMLYRCDHDVDVALPALAECLRWRNEFKVSSITAESVSQHLERGVMYIHGTDKEGRSILWFHAKYHKKDSSDVVMKQTLVYWLEKHYFETKARRMVVFFDMSSTGLQNMDLDFVKFLMSCFKQYYPGSLGCLFVYEIPWVLNAAWKIVKGWLDPAGQKKIIFVNHSIGLTPYFDAECLPPRLGGVDDYQFDVSELERDQSFNNALDLDSLASADADIRDGPGGLGGESKQRRVVTFAEDAVAAPLRGRLTRSASENTASIGAAQVSDATGHTRSKADSGPNSRQLAQRGKEIADQRLADLRTTATVHDGVKIVPLNELQFQSLPDEAEHVDAIALENTYSVTDGQWLAYKIKTTSPEKYRVRPSQGVLRAGDSVSVKVYLQNGYQQTAHRDKFLVLVAPVPSADATSESVDLTALWKTVAKESIYEHKLKCKVDTHAGGAQMNASDRHTEARPAIADIDRLRKRLGDVQHTVEQSAGQQSSIRTWIYFLCILLALVLVQQRMLHQEMSSLHALLENSRCSRS